MAESLAIREACVFVLKAGLSEIAAKLGIRLRGIKFKI